MKKIKFIMLICISVVYIIAATPVLANDFSANQDNERRSQRIENQLGADMFYALTKETITLEDAEMLATLRDALLLEETHHNIYNYTSRRLNTAVNLATNPYINVWLENKGSNYIRFGTQSQQGQLMQQVTVPPGQGRLLVIDKNIIVRYGTVMLPGMYALSYYAKADTINGNPISFTLRIKHYDG